MSFREAYEEYFKFVMKRQKKQSFETLLNDFNSRIIPYFEKENDVTIEITEDKIKKWYQEIESHNFSNRYNQKLFYTFKTFLNYLIPKYLECNYLDEMGNFRKHYELDKHDFYTLKEFNQFISGFDKDDIVYKRFFEFMFFVGTRPSEAMALKFSDLQGNYIKIDKTIHRHGKREFDTPKTYSSVRKILLDKKMVKELLELKLLYEKKYGVTQDYFIFGGLKPLSPTSIDRYKLKACKNACIRPITQHQFRHSHATLLIHKGIVINEVSRRLGHSKVSTTLNIYTHTNFEQEKIVQCTINSLRFNFFDTLLNDFKKIISILKH